MPTQSNPCGVDPSSLATIVREQRRNNQCGVRVAAEIVHHHRLARLEKLANSEDRSFGPSLSCNMILGYGFTA
jgi:hypothetical protein